MPRRALHYALSVTRPAMRIVSLVPGATDALVQLGAADLLVGRSHECDHPLAAAAPVLTRALGPPADAAGSEIDLAVRQAASSGSCLSGLDHRGLRAARPDLVVVQGSCGVCAIGPDEVERALVGSARAPRMLVLAPTRLSDVVRDIGALGDAIARPEAARRLMSELRARLERVSDARSARPRVRAVVLEWLDPPYRAGHWIPDQVRAAGGDDPLGRPGSRAEPVALEEVVRARPDAVILAPCGLSAAQAARQADRSGLHEALSALGRGLRVAAIDSGALVSRPGPRLVEGVEAMAAILHPQAGPEPAARAWAPAGRRRVTTSPTAVVG